MHFNKVIDLEKISLGPNQILVEFKNKVSTIVLAGSDGPSSTLEKEEVFLSTAEGINKGDLILDAKYTVGHDGKIPVHIVTGKKEVVGEGKDQRTITTGDRTFAVTNLHNVIMWTTPDNFKA